ncbi:hypothetical protein Sbal625DRAFT_4146 [Shewanella baltica OS625]|uniref:hypothetical protein n=1 Tax=Shewanella baltica TaxID=62322 RepID=UPI000230DF00|nr:hypothetical protein [Shewanella baltica]EHC04186.1 hypothetical protein Sbal625DRAFT_4146 [Shewanella baltica OS625]
MTHTTYTTTGTKQLTATSVSPLEQSGSDKNDIRYKTYAFECLAQWLQDNVDLGSALYFDSEGLVYSPEVLAAVNSSLLLNQDDVDVLDEAITKYIEICGSESPEKKAIAQNLSDRVNRLR